MSSDEIFEVKDENLKTTLWADNSWNVEVLCACDFCGNSDPKYYCCGDNKGPEDYTTFYVMRKKNE